MSEKHYSTMKLTIFATCFRDLIEVSIRSPVKKQESDADGATL